MRILNLYDKNFYTIMHSQAQAIVDISMQEGKGYKYQSSFVQKRDSTEYVEVVSVK